MTGLDPVKDSILEVAAIVTDWQLKEVASYEGVIRHEEAALRAKLARNGGFWNANPKAMNGLLEQNKHGLMKSKVERDLIAFAEEYCDDEPFLLAGNSIHMDRQFINKQWPELAKLLHYRMLDVSAWKVVFEGKYNKKFAKPEDHRALEDIRGSIQELKYYLGKVSA